MNKNQLIDLVSKSIGLSNGEKVSEDWEWDSLDHLSIVMNLQSAPEINIQALGDLSEVNSVVELLKRIEASGA